MATPKQQTSGFAPRLRNRPSTANQPTKEQLAATTFSVRCYVGTKEIIEQAARTTDTPFPEYVFRAAFERALGDVPGTVPDYPDFPRRETAVVRKRRQEEAAEAEGLSLEQWREQVLAEAAARRLSQQSTTGNTVRPTARQSPRVRRVANGHE